jgi:hypothetical protein
MKEYKSTSGKLLSLRVVEGCVVIQFTPDPTDDWTISDDDLETIVGCLQSSEED